CQQLSEPFASQSASAAASEGVEQESLHLLIEHVQQAEVGRQLERRVMPSEHRAQPRVLLGDRRVSSLLGIVPQGFASGSRSPRTHDMLPDATLIPFKWTGSS